LTILFLEVYLIMEIIKRNTRKPLIFNYKKNRDETAILLIKSENELYEYEVYYKESGLFLGYVGERIRENIPLEKV